MARYLKPAALGLIAGLVMASMALAAPTSNTSFTTYPTLNTTTPVNSNVVSHGALDEIFKQDVERVDKWAQFCDDDDCSENCGMSVSMANYGCLEQPPGRRSIKIHGKRMALEAITLIVAPAKGCWCQAFCTPVEWKGPRVHPQQSEAWPEPIFGPPLLQKMDYCWTISKFEWYGQHTEWSFRFRQEPQIPLCEPFHQCHWNNTPITTRDVAPP